MLCYEICKYVGVCRFECIITSLQEAASCDKNIGVDRMGRAS